MKENEFRKPNNCPYCGYFCDAATELEDENATPSVGDFSFCLKCAEVSQFDKNLKIVQFDLNEVKDKKTRIKLQIMKATIKQFWKEHPDLAPPL